MKRAIVFLLLCLATSPLYAQSWNWSWSGPEHPAATVDTMYEHASQILRLSTDVDLSLIARTADGQRALYRDADWIRSRCPTSSVSVSGE